MNRNMPSLLEEQPEVIMVPREREEVENEQRSGWYQRKVSFQDLAWVYVGKIREPWETKAGP